MILYHFFGKWYDMILYQKINDISNVWLYVWCNKSIYNLESINKHGWFNSIWLWSTSIQLRSTPFNSVQLCSTPFDSVWLRLTPFDSVWLCLTPFDSVSTLFDSIWLRSTLFDSVWLSSTPFDSFWLCLTLFDSIQLRLTPFNSVQLRSTPFDSVLPCLTPFDSVRLYSPTFTYVRLRSTPFNSVRLRSPLSTFIWDIVAENWGFGLVQPNNSSRVYHQFTNIIVHLCQLSHIELWTALQKREIDDIHCQWRLQTAELVRICTDDPVCCLQRKFCH
jgi:hypothetical protein